MIDFLFQPETMRAITPDFNALSYQVSGRLSLSIFNTNSAINAVLQSKSPYHFGVLTT